MRYQGTGRLHQSGFAQVEHPAKYLQGHYDTVLRSQPEQGEAEIHTYVDSDWAG